MIDNPKDVPNIMFSLVKKSFTYQGGALTALAAAPAFTVKQFFELILKGTDMRDLVIPLTLFGVLLILYMLVSIADFYTGISASKKEYIISTGDSRGFIQSDKLWSSVWKFLGVILIATILVVFTLIFAVLDMQWLYNIFLFGVVFFFLIVMLFDFHSIGENQFRRYGSKPKFYNFLEEATEVIKNGFIKKIGKLFE